MINSFSISSHHILHRWGALTLAYKVSVMRCAQKADKNFIICSLSSACQTTAFNSFFSKHLLSLAALRPGHSPSLCCFCWLSPCCWQHGRCSCLSLVIKLTTFFVITFDVWSATPYTTTASCNIQHLREWSYEYNPCFIGCTLWPGSCRSANWCLQS